MRKLWLLITASLFLTMSCDRIDVPVEPDPAEPSPEVIPMVEVHVNGDLNVPDTKVVLEKYKNGFKASWQQDNALFVEYTCGEYSGVSKFTWNTATEDFVGSLPDVTGDWNYKAYYLGRVGRYADEFTHNTICNGLNSMLKPSRYYNDCDYDDKYDPLYCNVDVSNSGPGVDEDGNGILFPLKRLTSILLFEFTSGIDEPIESAVLSVTSAEGTGIATADCYSITLTDDGSASFPSDLYRNTITCTFGEGVAADDFALWFSILPVDFETMTLTVTTKYHVFETQRKSAGSYEAGNIYTVSAAIPDSRWTDRYARASVGDVLLSCDFDEDPYLFEDLGGFIINMYGAETSQTNYAGGTAPEVTIRHYDGIGLIGFPTGMSEIMEVTFRANDISSLWSTIYNASPVAGESGLYRGYCIPDNVPSPTADLYIYNAGNSFMYVDDVVVKASDHEGFLTSAAQVVNIDPSSGEYGFYIASRNYNGTAEIRLSEELVENGFEVDCYNNELSLVSDGVYRVDSYPVEVKLVGIQSYLGEEDIEGTMTFVYEENGAACSKVCNVVEHSPEFITIADAVNDSYNYLRGKIDALYDNNYIVNDGTGAKFLYKNYGVTYKIGDYVVMAPGYVDNSYVYCDSDAVSLYEPDEPLVLTPTRLYKEDTGNVSVPFLARIAGEIDYRSYVDGYFYIKNDSDVLGNDVSTGDYVIVDGYLTYVGTSNSIFVAKDYYLLPTVEVLDADGEEMETPLACNREAQALTFKVRVICDLHNSDAWVVKSATADGKVTKSAYVVPEGDGLYTVYVNVAENKTPLQREGKVTLVFSLGEGMTMPYELPVYQSANEDAVGIPGDNFEIGGWRRDYDGLGDEILS